MKIKHSLVITSISGPNTAMMDYALKSVTAGWDFIVIGDKKSPADFHIEGCDFWNLERQKSLGFKLADELPLGHYSRKNLGFLNAIQKGAEVIIETDDDNLPYENFWEDRLAYQQARRIGNQEWVNVYRYFTENKIWPRGFPLDRIQQTSIMLDDFKMEKTYAPIQQGLADGDPDVDAIYRLIMPLPVNFRKENPVALIPGSYCPFNSQNTTWFKEAYPLMYLPSFCSFRMTDIWRSLIAQSITRQYGWHILFHSPTVYQERNFHDLLHDLKDEYAGYLENDRIVKTLNRIEFSKNEGNMGQNLLMAYESLVDNNFLPDKEIKLLKLWLDDLNKLHAG